MTYDDIEAALAIADTATHKTHGSILAENLSVLAAEVRRQRAEARSLRRHLDEWIMRYAE